MLSGGGKEDAMEFPVGFEVEVPDRTAESEVRDRERGEVAAAARLVVAGGSS